MSDTRTQVRLRPVIRVFVSSTFSDMKHERNALEADAFPKLEQLCQRHGFQFQAIDLRWGVSTEAGLDHRTMRICFDELRRAQEISPRPNFLILLGNRYGWRPLPEEISVEEFHTLEHAAAQIPGSADKSAVAVLREWYREDTNAVPPVYLLQSRRQDLGDDQDYTHDAVWNQVQAVLWTIINRAMPPEQLQRRFDGAASDGSPPAIVRFQASATEQEIWHGALRVPDAREHVLAFFREIENLAAFSDPKQIKDFVDVDPSGSVEVALQTEQDRLKAELRQRLGSANVFRNEAPARLVEAQDNQGGRTADVTTDHLAQLCADVVSRLSEIIQGQIEEYWRNTAQASTDRAARELEIEQREYERFAKERGGEESFVGRQVELQAILDYVGSDSRWPLVIHGASGCGKTALLARASQEVAKTRKRIERFIGVAPRSSDLRSLLSSLCQELRQRNPRADALPTEIKELRDEFSQHLQAATPEQPLILFLDALDQLADADNGRLLNWLPPGSLPAHVKLVVSCLSDRATGDPAGQPYAELKRRQIPAENFINLDVLSEAEARLLLFDRWLPKAGRKVSDDQRARIEQRLASPACRQPIFLKLLFEEVQLWHSYDPAPVPGESVPALLGQLFDRLSQPTNHGPLLVNRVLGYLSASRHGLAENEILEILFADPEYRAKLNEATEQTRHELPPNAKRIPIALWSRLRFDLAPYLTERAAPGANVLTFYHRQVGELATKRHLPEEERCRFHAALAAYFQNQADPDADGTWAGASKRGFSELGYHLASAASCAASATQSAQEYRQRLYKFLQDESFRSAQLGCLLLPQPGLEDLWTGLSVLAGVTDRQNTSPDSADLAQACWVAFRHSAISIEAGCCMEEVQRDLKSRDYDSARRRLRIIRDIREYTKTVFGLAALCAQRGQLGRAKQLFEFCEEHIGAEGGKHAEIERILGVDFLRWLVRTVAATPSCLNSLCPCLSASFLLQLLHEAGASFSLDARRILLSGLRNKLIEVPLWPVEDPEQGFVGTKEVEHDFGRLAQAAGQAARLGCPEEADSTLSAMQARLNEALLGIPHRFAGSLLAMTATAVALRDPKHAERLFVESIDHMRRDGGSWAQIDVYHVAKTAAVSGLPAVALAQLPATGEYAPELRASLALTYAMGGDHDQARSLAEQALDKLDPGNISHHDSIEDLVEVLILLGDSHRAHELFAVRARDPGFMHSSLVAKAVRLGFLPAAMAALKHTPPPADRDFASSYTHSWVNGCRSLLEHFCLKGDAGDPETLYMVRQLEGTAERQLVPPWEPECAAITLYLSAAFRRVGRDSDADRLLRTGKTYLQRLEGDELGRAIEVLISPVLGIVAGRRRLRNAYPSGSGVESPMAVAKQIHHTAQEEAYDGPGDASDANRAAFFLDVFGDVLRKQVERYVAWADSTSDQHESTYQVTPVTRSSRLGTTVPWLMAIGQPGRAEEVAASLRSNDPSDARDKAFYHLLQVHLESGTITDALRFAAQICHREEVDWLHDFNRDHAFFNCVAAALSRAQTEEAWRALTDICENGEPAPTPSETIYASAVLASACAYAGMDESAQALIRRALEVADTLEDERARNNALTQICEYAPSLHDADLQYSVLDACTRIARGFVQEWKKSDALEKIAAAFAAGGDWVRAIDVVNGMEKGSFDADGVLSKTAMHMCRAHAYGELLTLSRQITNSYWLVDLAREIGPLLIGRASADPQALATLAALAECLCEDPAACAELIPFLVNAGCAAQAAAAAEAAIKPERTAIASICGVLGRIGVAAKCLPVLEKCLVMIPQLDDKNKDTADAVASLAKCVGETAPRDAAARLLDQCERIIEQNTRNMGYVVPGEALSHVAVARHRCGDYAGALNTLRGIWPEMCKVQGAVALAAACEESGEIGNSSELIAMAKEWARSIPSGKLHGDREKAEKAIARAESEERHYQENVAKLTYIEPCLPAHLHRLLANGEGHADQEDLGKLVEALAGFVGELEEGAHRDNCFKDEYYENVINILTDDLGLFDIAWGFVEVVTPLTGDGHYIDRGVHLLRMLKKGVSDSSISRTVSLGAKLLERSEYNEFIKILSTFLRKEESGLLVKGLPRMLVTRPLEFSTVFHVVIEACAAALASDRQDIAIAVMTECSWIGCDVP